jgi:hypothetical protein
MLRLVLVAAIALTACSRAPKRLDPVPVELAPRVATAEAAASDLRSTLGTRLLTVVGKEGPVAGIDVCSNEARSLTAEVAARNEVEIGRTSTRLRNPDNAPRPWLKSYLEETAGKPAASVASAVYDLGDRLGVARPLEMAPQCAPCHGDPASIPAPVKAALEQRYPQDRATGSSVGEVRGVLWVEIPKGG